MGHEMHAHAEIYDQCKRTLQSQMSQPDVSGATRKFEEMSMAERQVRQS